MRRHAFAAFALAVSLAGCWLADSDAVQAARESTDACVADSGQPLLDLHDGFWLCMPGSWRDLRPGNPSWVEVFGTADSDVEQQVASGSIDHFAMPLEPRDADPTVNLTIYVTPVPVGADVVTVSRVYMDSAAQQGAHDETWTRVPLASGASVEVTGIRDHTAGAEATDWFDAYVIVKGSTAYHFVFISLDQSRDTFTPIFREIAESIGFPPS
jgi:hypothetical protein